MKKQRTRGTEKTLTTCLLELLNNIVNTVNVAASIHQIEHSVSNADCEKIKRPFLLAKSEHVKLKGQNTSVRKIKTQQTNLIFEKAREKKVFK